MRGLAGVLGQFQRPGTYQYGRDFEAFIVTEIYKLMKAREKDWRLSYLRTKDDSEIDLIIERPGKRAVAIEIKSAERVIPKEVGSFERLARDPSRARLLFLSRDPIPQRHGRPGLT